METVDKIAETKTDMNDRPVTEQKIKKVTVEDFGQEFPFKKL
jgi:peptidyl-prolyl cis-trans isomerase B (cyclophilin B)